MCFNPHRGRAGDHSAQILARSLANFYRQYSGHNRARVDNLTVCYRKKHIDVSFSCVWPVTDNEFRHNIVKVVCGSPRGSTRGHGSTATLTML